MSRSLTTLESLLLSQVGLIDYNEIALALEISDKYKYRRGPISAKKCIAIIERGPDPSL